MKLRVLASALVVLGLSLAGTVPAWAHAALVSSTPRDGAELDRLPAQVTFTFSEDVSEPAYVVVRSADGTAVTSGDPVVEGTTVTQPLGGTGATGRFTMAYRVVSVDGHPVTGELDFTVSGTRQEAPASGAKGSTETIDEPGTTGESGDESGDGSAQTSADTAPTAAGSEGGFWAEHGVHYVVGGALLAVALALLLTARGRSG